MKEHHTDAVPLKVAMSSQGSPHTSKTSSLSESYQSGEDDLDANAAHSSFDSYYDQEEQKLSIPAHRKDGELDEDLAM